MRTIFVLAILCPFLSMCQPITLKGKIINEQMEPIAGATITLHHSNNLQPGTYYFEQQTIANQKGEFTLPGMRISDTLIISAVGYTTHFETFDYTTPERITIVLTRKTSMLDEAVIIAYGKTTRRLNTGSVSKVSSESISRQPVSNPVATLQGQIPGLLVTQGTGKPGSTFSLQLRGTNSLKQGTQPLIMVDGMPFMLNSGTLSSLAPDVQSVLNTLNPADIESIEVLKDADATAIYGSQGANGVVLITTKKGREGKTSFDLNYYTGFGRPARNIELLNTTQYLQMRREAFANDGNTPTVNDAPDLLLWDSTRNTSWQKELLGTTARTTNVQASLSGGSATTSFMVSTGYYSESTVFPQAAPATRGSVRLNLSHTSPSKKLSAVFNTVYASDNRNSLFADLTSFILLPPNAPALFDSAGNLVFTPGLENPMAYLYEKYKSNNANLLASATVNYNLPKGFSLRLALGYNAITLTEQQQTPIKAQQPSPYTTATLQLGTGAIRSWLAEPQLLYKTQGTKLGIQVLSGLSFQQREQTRNSTTGYGIPSDDLIGNIASASQLYVSNSFTQYNYAAAFGRITGNWIGRYILNANLRRDGSSRFGPASRWANFGAFGAAWLLSEEPFFKKALPILSYAKLRGSYGITGNDQVGDYAYLDSWNTATSYGYNGAAGILPARLSNPFYQWEKNKKLEAAIELGLLKEILWASAAWYSNRSSGLLTNYKLPAQTGFANIFKNLDATIENSGTEFELTAKLVRSTSVSWTAKCMLTIPVSKLIRYPNLQTSADRLLYALGQPVKSVRTYTYLGVDKTTGTYQFQDVNGDGIISFQNDLANFVPLTPKFYGSFQNTLTVHNLSCSFLFYGVKQTGRNFLSSVTAPPGDISNQPVEVWQRWQIPGQQNTIQQFTASPSNPAYQAYNNYRNSSAMVSDASFIRLRNISFSLKLPQALLSRTKMQDARIYIEGQNLFTITSYRGSDPETQNLLVLPPLKLLAAGIQLTF